MRLSIRQRRVENATPGKGSNSSPPESKTIRGTGRNRRRNGWTRNAASRGTRATSPVASDRGLTRLGSSKTWPVASSGGLLSDLSGGSARGLAPPPATVQPPRRGEETATTRKDQQPGRTNNPEEPTTRKDQQPGRTSFPRPFQWGGVPRNKFREKGTLNFSLSLNPLMFASRPLSRTCVQDRKSVV